MLRIVTAVPNSFLGYLKVEGTNMAKKQSSCGNQDDELVAAVASCQKLRKTSPRRVTQYRLLKNEKLLG